MKKKLLFNAPFTLTFTVLALLSLLLNKITDGASNRLFFSVYRCPLRTVPSFLRFFLHVLGHADYSHFSGNFLLILVLGPGLEERYGSRKLLFCVLTTALLTGLIQFICFPSTGILGASGIVFMMIIMASMTGMRDRRLPVTALLVLVLYLGKEIAQGLFTEDNISQLSHVIGGLCGAEFGFAFSNGRFHRKS